MNIMYLKYAVEVEKARSISRAAQKLYIAQPNLSRALKELEDDLGITIFNRTPHGMQVTDEGEEFLERAKKILRRIEELEDIYSGDNEKKAQSFSVSVPRSSYMSYAFTRFAAAIDNNRPAELFYKETNSSRAITNILEAGYRLGIIRYAEVFDRYFKDMLDRKKLTYEMITEFSYVLVMSKNHPLASKEDVTFEDLEPYTEIAHADPFVPSLSMSAVRKEELPDNIDRRIFVFERASQMDLLSHNPNTFMWISPMPKESIERYGLVQKRCSCNTKIYKDVLIYRKDYKLTELDKSFIEEVYKARDEIF